MGRVGRGLLGLVMLLGPSLAAEHRKPAPSLKAASALVVDQRTGETLLDKRSAAVVPIASLTKLMTALVVLESRVDLRSGIRVEAEDVDSLRHSRSRLPVGTPLSRWQALQLALLASENRAAHALGRTHPGGMTACVAAMNAKAQAMGLRDTRFEDTSGLHGGNVSSARDLVRILDAASRVKEIRDASTLPELELQSGGWRHTFPNTNPLVRGGTWDIGLSKTGYIEEAGPCLALQAQVAGRPLLMVFLDAPGKYSRMGDAARVRQWLGGAPSPAGKAALKRLKAGGRNARAVGKRVRGRAPKGALPGRAKAPRRGRGRRG